MPERTRPWPSWSSSRSTPVRQQPVDRLSQLVSVAASSAVDRDQAVWIDPDPGDRGDLGVGPEIDDEDRPGGRGVRQRVGSAGYYRVLPYIIRIKLLE